MGEGWGQQYLKQSWGFFVRSSERVVSTCHALRIYRKKNGRRKKNKIIRGQARNL